MKTKYQKGDKVRLVSKRNPDWPDDGSLDRFLGSIQIIKNVSYYDVMGEHFEPCIIEFEDEDASLYEWNLNDIECKVSDEVEFEQGETVLVWDNFHDEKRPRIFLSKISCVEAYYPFVVIDPESSAGVSTWKNCEKIPVQQIELTIEEIAEKFGVNPEQIKIK